MPFVLALLVASCLMSCSMSGDEEEGAEAASNTTLRAEAEAKRRDAAWASPLENGHLNADIHSNGKVSKDIDATPEVAAVSNASFDALYPYIKSFGSLDDSAITSEVRNVLDGFCAAVNGKKDITPFMAEGMEHLSLFFKDDLEKALYPFTPNPYPLAHIYGRPFFSGECIIVPVRFTNEAAYTDIEVCLESYKITQLRLLPDAQEGE